MERKIGEIFELGGEWYQCVESDSCGECSLFTAECGSGTKSNLADKIFGQCSRVRRSDNKHAIFKKLEKVGESYTFVDKTVQNYLLETEMSASPEDVFILTNNELRLIAIEIKQTKEDMEGKKTNFVEAIDALCKRYNMSDGVRIDFMSELKEIIKDKEKCNLKPFNLEAAKAGKPVCTRDGRKARIICWDRIDSTGCNLPIVALVQCEETEVLQLYHDDGKCDVKADLDLMMLPEKKEGWVNVYKGGLLDTKSYPTKKEAFDKACPEGYVDTVKVCWEE